MGNLHKIKSPLKKPPVIDKLKKSKAVKKLKNGMGVKQLQVAQLSDKLKADIRSGQIATARDRLAKELKFWRNIPKFIRPPKPKLADFLSK